MKDSLIKNSTLIIDDRKFGNIETDDSFTIEMKYAEEKESKRNIRKELQEYADNYIWAKVTADRLFEDANFKLYYSNEYRLAFRTPITITTDYGTEYDDLVIEFNSEYYPKQIKLWSTGDRLFDNKVNGEIFEKHDAIYEVPRDLDRLFRDLDKYFSDLDPDGITDAIIQQLLEIDWV